MATTDVAGSVPAVEPVPEQQWRAVFARASVLFGLLGLVVLAVVLVADLTFWLGPRDVDINAVLPGGFAALAGVVSGFLGRKSTLRRTSIVGSVLSWAALLGVAWASFMVPYEPGINGLAWSPDGTRIAYAGTWAAADGADGIWVVPADGSSEPTQLIARGSAPVWSPDGATIAYANESRDDLWLMDADGQNGRRITGGWSPDWSPDGAQIAFVAPRRDGSEDVWIVDADGGNRHRITDGSDPVWSPDGTRIAFAWAPQGEGSEGVWIVDADGGNLHRIADGSDPDWSPDGTMLVHTTHLSQRPWTRTYWVINADGTGRTQLPDLRYSQPQWTADGRLTSDCPEGLSVMDADGSNRQVLLAGERDRALSDRVFSPDGTRVAYVTRAGIKSDIVVTTIDGSNQITLIH
jgi:Tol biopolymer transport system component